MIVPDLAPCYTRFHQVIRAVLEEHPECTSLATQEPQFHSRRQVRQWQAEMSAFLRYLEPGSRVLDFGTGSGISAVPFAYAGCRVDAIDIDASTEMSLLRLTDNSAHTDAAAEQRTYWPSIAKAFPGVTFGHYRDTVPFESGTFDAVMAFGVLEHIPGHIQLPVIQELYRVLAPGGHLFITYLPRKLAACEWIARFTGHQHHEFLWGDNSTRKYLDANGFDIVSFERVVAAPQHPAELSNRYERVFDVIDKIAARPGLDLLSHHMRIVARKR